MVAKYQSLIDDCETIKVFLLGHSMTFHEDRIPDVDFKYSKKWGKIDALSKVL